VWRSKGQDYALKLIADANRIHPLVHVRWVWLDAPPGAGHCARVPLRMLGPVRHGRDVTYSGRGQKGPGHLYTYVPVDVGAGRSGALELSESLSTMKAFAGMTMIRTLALIGVLVLLSAIFLVLLGYRMVGRPLRALIGKTRRVGQGDLSEPIDVHGHDELSELAAALNQMCVQLEESRLKTQIETEGKIKALEQLRHEDRLKTIGLLASGVAHELGTPLNVVSGRATMIASGDLSTGEISDSACVIKSQAERMTSIIKQMLDFARRSPSEMRVVELGGIVRRTIDILSPLASKHAVSLRLDGDQHPLPAILDPQKLEQVLTNLVVNAIQSMQRAGEVRISIRCERSRSPAGDREPEREYIRIDISDEGRGIRAEDIPRIFEPFFSTKQAGHGTGLGLSIVQGIVQEHGGWMDVASEVGKGSRFSVFLPKGDSACQARS
jgi:two-component system, NtrC family, sensor kinase